MWTNCCALRDGVELGGVERVAVREHVDAVVLGPVRRR